MLSLKFQGRALYSNISLLLRLTFIAFLAEVTLPSNGHAVPPAWWTQRGVMDLTKTPNDYAAVNQGQLKSIAELAAVELGAHLPGGINVPAGIDLQQLLAKLRSPSAATNDYAAVNLGQLKAIAKPFYKLLINVGYTTSYPWEGQQSAVNDYAAANVGQVKNLFSFDLTVVTVANDLDHDGLPDWWEKAYFLNYPDSPINPDAPSQRGDGLTILQAFQQGLNPNDVYNQQPPTVTIISGNEQKAGPGGYLSQTLTVLIRADNLPVVNQTVTFNAQNNGQVQATMTGAAAPTISVQTNSSGIARAFVLLPSIAGTTCLISATAGTAPRQSTATFTATADSSFPVQSAPATVGNPVCTQMPDGSQLLTWTNNTDDPVPIWHKDAQGHETLVKTLAAGTTSYLFEAP